MKNQQKKMCQEKKSKKNDAISTLGRKQTELKKIYSSVDPNFSIPPPDNLQ